MTFFLFLQPSNNCIFTKSKIFFMISKAWNKKNIDRQVWLCGAFDNVFFLNMWISLRNGAHVRKYYSICRLGKNHEEKKILWHCPYLLLAFIVAITVLVGRPGRSLQYLHWISNPAETTTHIHDTGQQDSQTQVQLSGRKCIEHLY